MRCTLRRRSDRERNLNCTREIAIRSLAAFLLAIVAACSSPRPQPEGPASDRQLVEASSAGRLAYELGDYAQARTLYRRTLARAHAIDAGAQAADAAYNLAMSEIGLRDYEAAEEWLVQAEYDAHRASAETTDIRLLRAKVAYLRERLPQALSLANEVIASGASPRLVAQARALRGQAFSDAGDLAAAKSELHALEALVGAAKSALTPSIEADINKLEGTIALREGNTALAASLFDEEAELLRIANRHRDMAHALARSAQAQMAAGRPVLAADRYFLAGRSLAGQREFSTAKAFAASSLSAARAAGDDAARARARLLLEEISRRDVP